MNIVKIAAVAVLALTPALVTLPAHAQSSATTTTASETITKKPASKSYKHQAHKKTVKTEVKTNSAK